MCQYENSANGDLLIDRHPVAQNVWLVGAGSGHGFKHGPEVGRMAAELVLSDGTAKEPRFSLATRRPRSSARCTEAGRAPFSRRRSPMPVLSDSERDAFLREPGLLMRFATVKPDGAPYATAIWYAFEDGALWFTPRKESVWRQHLLRDPRIAVVIDEQAFPYRKVVIEGRAQLAFALGRDAEWRDRYRRIAERYVPPAGADHYITETIDQTRALFTLPLASARVRTWRMPVGDEPYVAIWAQRYYAGTKLAKP